MWLKALATPACRLAFDSQDPCKTSDVVVCICNPSTPTVRREAETNPHKFLSQLAWLMQQQQTTGRPVSKKAEGEHQYLVLSSVLYMCTHIQTYMHMYTQNKHILTQNYATIFTTYSFKI